MRMSVLAAGRSRLTFPAASTDTSSDAERFIRLQEQLACNPVAMANSQIGRMTILVGTGTIGELKIAEIARRAPGAVG